jgi:hypothetical protein
MINKSTKYYNLDDFTDSNDNKYFIIDSIFEFDGFTTKERRLIRKKCTYICDICNNDYMFTCPECESAKEFEFEVEKQRFIQRKNRKYTKNNYALNKFINN